MAYTDCLALLFFIEKYPLQVAFGVYSSAVSKLDDLSAEDQISRSYITEILHQARAKLLFFHRKTKSAQLRPIEIRHILQESISLFPNNTIFLSLLVWNESRFNVLDRIRNVHLLTNDSEARYSFDSDSALSATALQPVPITTHLLSIWSELCRPTWAGSTHHSTRAAFEKVLYDNSNHNSQRSGGQQLRNSSGMESAQSSAMIWKLYIIFETYCTRDIGAAKAVFYRAIRACPWSKQLFMLAFQYLQDDVEHRMVPVSSGSTGFLFDDLRQLYQAMTEKQLRIHVNIEDKIQQVIAERRDISEDGLETKSIEGNEI